MLTLEINEMHLVQHTYLHLYANSIVLIIIKNTIKIDLDAFSQRKDRSTSSLLLVYD